MDNDEFFEDFVNQGLLKMIPRSFLNKHGIYHRPDELSNVTFREVCYSIDITYTPGHIYFYAEDALPYVLEYLREHRIAKILSEEKSNVDYQ